MKAINIINAELTKHDTTNRATTTALLKQLDSNEWLTILDNQASATIVKVGELTADHLPAERYNIIELPNAIWVQEVK